MCKYDHGNLCSIPGPVKRAIAPNLPGPKSGLMCFSELLLYYLNPTLGNMLVMTLSRHGQKTGVMDFLLRVELIKDHYLTCVPGRAKRSRTFITEQQQRTEARRFVCGCRVCRGVPHCKNLTTFELKMSRK